MSGSDVHLDTPRHRLRAHLARPAGEGPWPGVVVVHDAFGFTDDARHQADWLAGAGFLAVAPDLYSRPGRTAACVVATFRELSAREGAAFDDLEAARAWLAGRDDCTGKVGVIGYCMGGAFALLLAPRGFDASSVNYGVVPKDELEETLVGACPIVGSFGGRDRTLPGAAARLERALTTLDVPHDVHEYPDAGHSFLNDHDTVIARVLGRLGTFARDEPSAEDARARIEAFFRTHLA